MTQSLFGDLADLDINFLESAYGDDAETAAVVFEDYLKELPSNLQSLKESFNNKNVETFRQLVHKQKPAFTYVGLTDVTNVFNELQTKCATVSDLDLYKNEIEKVITRIESTKELLEKTLERLQASQ